MRRLALLTTVALLAGCSLGGDGGSAATVEPDELSKVVLQPQDLPRVFIRFDEGRQGFVDQSGRRADPTRFGRQDGWKARYRRPGTNRTAGPLVVASLVDVFDGAGGAEDELSAAQADLDASDTGWRTLDAPGLGDASFARTTVQGAGTGAVRFYVIGWRQANAVASLEVNGFDGKLQLADAAALAEKQARRLGRAAEA